MNKNFSIQGLQNAYEAFTGNGGKFREPTSVTFKSENITKQDRTMDGTLLVDYIATKRTVSVSWNVLDDIELKALEDFIEPKRNADGLMEFFEIVFSEDDADTTQTMRAYAGGIDFYPYFLSDGSVVWRDVKIVFTEV